MSRASYCRGGGGGEPVVYSGAIFNKQMPRFRFELEYKPAATGEGIQGGEGRERPAYTIRIPSQTVRPGKKQIAKKVDKTQVKKSRLRRFHLVALVGTER